MTSPLEPVIGCLKTHAPTSRHAELLFGLLVDALGDQAVVTTQNDGTLRKLFRHDAVHVDLIVPWPVAQLSLRGRIGWVSPTYDSATGEVVPEAERPAGKPSKLRGLGPAELEIYDGSAKVAILYGDDGQFREASLNDLVPSRLAEIPGAVATDRAQPVELIASCVAMFDHGRHGPGRVRRPAPVPNGPDGLWSIGLIGARRALYAGRVPSEARFVVVDAIAGTAIGTGATLAAATAAFEAEVAKSPPKPSTERHTAWDDYDDDGNLIRRGKPPRPGAPLPETESDPWVSDEPEEPVVLQPGVVSLGGGVMQFSGPKPDVPLPEITLSSVPYAVIQLAASPTVPPPMGRWERTIGWKGATVHVARRVGPEGFLQIGERVLWVADPRTIEDALDEVDARDREHFAPPAPWSALARFHRYQARTYRWAEARRENPARFERHGGASGPHYDGSDLDGDIEGSLVRRHVKIKRGTS